ncbi:MAG: hypothetical protein PHN39_00300 [Candidatus Pacebacteria bacterium]|nr:hypothetical protein [Candidatus Paceibacterota bacterium]
MTNHRCGALVFRCMDFRIKPSILSQLLMRVGYSEGSYDLVSVAGACKDLLSDKSGERDFLIKQIKLSQQLHNIQEVVMLYHDNCGAYGVPDVDQEYKTQASDLSKIKSLLADEFPDLIFSAYIIKGVPADSLSLEKLI